MAARDAGVKARELSEILAVVYRVGYSAALILLGIGVLLPLVGLESLGIAAYAGIAVLLATPVAAALAVGVMGGRGRDSHLVLVVVGIFLLLVAAAWIQMS